MTESKAAVAIAVVTARSTGGMCHAVDLGGLAEQILGDRRIVAGDNPFDVDPRRQQSPHHCLAGRVGGCTCPLDSRHRPSLPFLLLASSAHATR